MGAKSTSTARADPWAPTQDALKGIIGDATSLYKKGGFDINPYKGDWYANQNQDTLGAQAGLRGLIPQMTDYNAQAAGNVASMLGQGPSQAMKDNVIADIMPAVNGSFAGSGMTGSTLHQQNLTKGLSAGLGSLDMQNRQQQAQLSQQLMGMSSGMAQPYAMLGAQGQAQQAYDQGEIDAAMRKDLMGKSSDMSALQQYAQLISGLGGQFGTQTNTQSQGMGLGGVLGLGLQGLSLFSDRRLKENVRRVGTADNGLPIYTYTYRGSPTVHMGVMAQDVAEIAPEAVHERAGYLAVDYARAF